MITTEVELIAYSLKHNKKKGKIHAQFWIHLKLIYLLLFSSNKILIKMRFA